MKIGRVLLIQKGDYNPSENYEILDVVRYNSASYVCRQNCTGISPADDTHWKLLVEDGVSIANITEQQSGRDHLITITYTDDREPLTFTIQDGLGGDMFKSEYAKLNIPETVDTANALKDASNETLKALSEKEDEKGNRVLLFAGEEIKGGGGKVWTGSTEQYAIDDAEGKVEDGTVVVIDDDEAEPSYVDPNDFDLTNGVLALNKNVTTKLQDIYDNGFASKNLAWFLGNYNIIPNGSIEANSGVQCYVARVEVGETYTLSALYPSSATLKTFRYSFFATSPTPSTSAITNRETPNNSPFQITVPSGAKYVAFAVETTASNVQIEKGIVENPQYQVGAKSNVEITEELQTISQNATCYLTGTFDRNVCKRTGNVVNISLRVYGTSASTTSTNIFKLPKGFEPKAETFVFGVYMVNNVALIDTYRIKPDGNIETYRGTGTSTQFGINATYII